MKITSATFVKGITGTQEIIYDGRFQVAFMGRSNAGKSTLINSLTGKKNLVRTSSQPGQTIRMDFFLINNSFYFVDFPGYGYARAKIDKREKLRKMILWYLMYSEVTNRIVILIIDAEIGLTEFDHDAIETLYEYNIEHIIIANKIDKLKRDKRIKQLATIRKECGDSKVIPFSSKLNIGRSELLENLNKYTL